MLLRQAALAAVLVVLCANVRAQTTMPLTLDDAFARVVETHPDLRVFRHTQAALSAERERAALKPPLVAGAEVENALGTGNASGVGGAEITLSLAGVLERGGKRAARQALAASRFDALAVERETRRLDLLAEVARRYLDVVAAQAEARIAAEDLAQRERTVVAAARRVQAGASPESVRLAAEALRARAGLERDRARLDAEAAYRRLALLWSEREPAAVADIVGDSLRLAPVPAFAELAALLERTPELRRFAFEARLRESRLQLARSERAPDLDWQIGVRRLQEDSDWGLVGSVSLPLGSARRAAPSIRAAEAELAALDLERESGELALYATLAQAHGQYVAAQTEVARSRDDLLPRLRRAEAAAERAYRAGALSYLEWAQLQNETTAARRQQLAAALQAHRALIEIQRLTGEPFALPAAAGEETDR